MFLEFFLDSSQPSADRTTRRNSEEKRPLNNFSGNELDGASIVTFLLGEKCAGDRFVHFSHTFLVRKVGRVGGSQITYSPK